MCIRDRDYGPNITKIILETGRPLIGAKLDPKQFSVFVERIIEMDEDFEWPKFMGEKPEDAMKGIRTVTGLYVSDAAGEPQEDGTCITLNLACHPMDSLGSILFYDGEDVYKRQNKHYILRFLY